MIKQNDVLVQRADVLNGLKSLCMSRPDWYMPLRAVAVQVGVFAEFEEFVEGVAKNEVYVPKK